MPGGGGWPVVLTADRTLMAGYRLLFDGMLAASQTTTTPRLIMERVLAPATSRDGIRSRLAPLGLRRIEAALIDGGFSADEVVVANQAGLAEAVGPRTQIVAVSSGEPCGLGMNTSTMTAIAGGRIYPQVLARELLARVRRLIADTGSDAKVIVGGPGAWQLAGDEAARGKLGVDHVVTGYAEGNVAGVFRALAEGCDLPEVIAGEGVPSSSIPRICGASTMGVVEISRGCGLGCEFCTIGRVPMDHLPVEAVVADAEANLAAGLTSIAALSEDFLRYGGDGARVAPEALMGLLRSLRSLSGLRLIQVDHVNVLSIARYADAELREVRNLLVGDTGCEYPWVNVGVETAAGDLLETSGGGAKMGPGPASGWGELCAEQLRRLVRAGFLPMASLMIGLPGETTEHIRRTLDWVQQMRDEPITVFPMLYAPINGDPTPTGADLGPLHWQLIRDSYRLNFRWIPPMYWDNQQAAGVPVWRRLLLQALGRAQVAQWELLFAWHSRKARR